jgi:hypothetical protein
LDAEALIVRRLYWASFALRFLAGLLAWYATVALELPMMEDADYYEQMGALVAEHWLAGESSPELADAVASARPQAWMMVVTVAALHCLTGGARLLPVLLGLYSLLTAATPVVIYRVARQLGAPQRAAVWGAALVACSPAFAFWSGALYKEGLILLVLSLIMRHAIRLQAGFHLPSLLVVAGSLPVLFGLRFYLVGIVGVSLAVGLLLKRERNSGAAGLGLQQLVTVGLLAAILVGTGSVAQVGQVLPSRVGDALEQMQLSRDDLASYGSGYLRDAKVASGEEAARFLPVGIVYFLSVPFPWQLGSLRQNLVIPETAFWVALYPLVVIGIRQGLRYNFPGTILLLVFTFVLCCFYGLFVGNIGTAYRQRIQIWLFWAIFAGWGWYSVRIARQATP